MHIKGVGKGVTKKMLGIRKSILTDPWPLLQLWRVRIGKHQRHSKIAEEAFVSH